MKITSIVGTRPNFVKIAPLLRSFNTEKDIESTLLHTGQHYDKFMSDVFFEDLRIDKPRVHFNVGSGSHLKVIAKIMVKAEEHFTSSPTDLIVVVGDVNSTLAIALAGNKMGIPIAHVEAGLRSRNWNMPEETNRILTDRLSELLLTPTKEDSENLIDEGIEEEKIHFVGNIMIDSLFDSLERIGDGSEVLDRYSINGAKYGLITLHRPECVDNKENLISILDAFEAIQQNIKLIWPQNRFQILPIQIATIDSISISYK